MRDRKKKMQNNKTQGNEFCPNSGPRGKTGKYTV